MKEILCSNYEYMVKIDKEPDQCPLCHRNLVPELVHSYKCGDSWLELIYRCTNSKCQSHFITYYQNVGHPSTDSYFFRYRRPFNFQKEQFPEIIEKTSKSFSEIYNQALNAEKMELLEICGAGYRKALEFLIKDYAVQNNPKDKNTIEKKHLVQCIEDYIGSPEVKICAKRAAWLGNDETHYYQKWSDKDLEDLKTLIKLTVNWIHSIELTKKYEKEMPDKKRTS